jgi:hypothetical protein
MRAKSSSCFDTYAPPGEDRAGEAMRRHLCDEQRTYEKEKRKSGEEVLWHMSALALKTGQAGKTSNHAPESDSQGSGRG